MADKRATVASGADPSGQTLRQRNVPGSAPSGPPPPYELEEKKLHGKKKVHAAHTEPIRALTLT
jgi:hypothetical protein